ncbi:MAG: hypothetical protein RL071_3973 [Pseudomonadota bacterium]
MLVPGYRPLSRLLDGHNAMVWTALREADDQPVVLKVLRGPRPSAEQRARFWREVDITRAAQGPGVVRLLDVVDDPHAPAMVLEDLDAKPLAQHIADGLPPIAAALAVGLGAARALIGVHSAKIVHRDLSPGNLIWDPDSGAVTLIDFGISSRGGREAARGASARPAEGTLATIAPEQTGRTNRSIDHRADLYGLGATLYHLLTGRPPFVGADALDVVSGHLSRAPTPPDQLRAAVPPALSAVVLRLLAKAPDDRYQTAAGLAADLAALQSALAAGRPLDGFTPGQHDRPAGLQLSERLVGRTGEVAVLHGAFGRARAGARGLLLVGGYAGIGKTALVGELLSSITVSEGVFLAGKYDQVQRDLPYAGLFGALRGLVAEVLAGDDESLEVWRARFAGAVGELGQLLVDAVPALGALLGPQPAPPPLTAAEAEARFDGLMLRVLRALSGPAHPLVLFLDDLQWADVASLRLLLRLVRDPATSHALIIGAFRDNEVNGAHPLALAVRELEAERAPLSALHLGPLRPDDSAQLVCEAVERADPEAAALAALLHQRTGGNPFFLTRALTALGEDGLIARGPDGRFTWDEAAVAAATIDEDVVTFLSRRLDELPADTRRALALGALLGARFTLDALGRLQGWPPARAAAALGAARAAGLLLRADASPFDEADLRPDGDPPPLAYRFLHDRVQQAAEGILAADERAALRLHVARAWASAGEAARADRLFDLVAHYAAARALVTDPAERAAAAHLMLTAGRRAIAAAAFGLAQRTLEAGVSLLPADAWQADRPLALGLTEQACVAAWLAGDFARMDALRAIVVEAAPDPMARLAVDEAHIQSMMARNRVNDAVDLALAVLDRLGEPLPHHPGPEDVGGALQAALGALGAAGPDALVRAPLCADPQVLAAQRIKINVFGAAYYGRPMLAPVLGFSVVQRSVSAGPSPETAMGLTVVGLILCSAGQLEAGLQLGDQAVAVNDRMDDRRLAGRTLHMLYTHVRIWADPWRSLRDRLREVYASELSGGDVEFAAFSAFMSCTLSLHVGDPLDEVDAGMTQFAGAIRSLGQETSLLGLKMQHQAVAALRGASEDPLLVAGPLYDERTALPDHIAKADASNLYVFYTTKLFLLVYQGAFDEAAAAVEAAMAWQAGAVSSVFVPAFTFLSGLTAAEQARRGAPDRDALLTRARALRDQVAAWAAMGPANQRHRVDLLDALLAAAEGRLAEATPRFEAAIAGARAQGWLHDEALALDLAGRAHLDGGLHFIGQAFLGGARQTWARWGAKARLARLDQELGGPAPGAGPTSARVRPGWSLPATATIPLGTTALGGGGLDLAALLKASQALTSRLQLTELVPALLEAARSAAGATAAALLLPGETGLRPVGAVAADGGPAPHLLEAGALPQRALRLVARSQRLVLLGEGPEGEQLKRDPAVRDRGLRSLLCAPLLSQGRLAAVLWLEHDQAEGAFPPERARVVEALAAQAAIAIENARLFEDMEQQVRARTAELVAARTEAEGARDRADGLLLNMLPRRVVDELKAAGSYPSRHIPAATVLFTDFQGFTAASERMAPTDLVAELERCFGAFDRIVDRNGVEKVKTIGDAYMAIGGAPIPNRTHPVDCVLAALQMRDHMSTPGPDGQAPLFALRIGVHTGPLVAGVIGERRLAYDVWGDTVNTASRMESSGAVGRVNVSAATWAAVQGFFVGTPRGKVAAKGKGEVEMVFVDGLRPALSVDGRGQTPNGAFWALRGAL